MRRIAAALLILISAWAADVGKHAEAPAILDRYVEVTGGKAAYQKIGAVVTEVTTSIGGQTIPGTIYHARDGRSRTVMEIGGRSREGGVVNGIAWQSDPASGNRILQGKEAAEKIAESRSFLEDQWRSAYPKVAWKEAITINGKLCDGVMRTRTDGQESEAFYDRATGLQIREVVFADGTTTVKQQLDVGEYATAQGIRYPKVMNIVMGGVTGTIKIESISFSAEPPKDAFIWPDFILKEMAHPGSAAPTAADGLPSAPELMARFIERSGGKDAYSSIKTQHLTGKMSFTSMNISANIESLSGMGGQSYTALELPGAGKFEFGSDGRTSWEKSTMTGARIVPTAQRSGGLVGPGPDQLMQLLQQASAYQTVGKEDANGAPCYLVRPTGTVGLRGSSMCFDVASGLMTKMSVVVQTQMGVVPADMVLGEYRPENGVQMPHLIQTSVSGQPVNVEITNIAINREIPPSTFDLPDDVKALRDKAGVAKTPDAVPERPSLKRAH